MRDEIKSIFMIFFLCCCCACSSNEYEQPERVKISYRLMHEHIKEMKDSIGVTPFGIGGRFLEKVNTLHLNFRIRGEYDIESARELLVKSVNRFLERINSDPEIRPYLVNFPFTAENIEYSFDVITSSGRVITFKGDSRYEGSLSRFSAFRGLVVYAVMNEVQPNYCIVFEETFEQATVRLQENK